MESPQNQFWKSQRHLVITVHGIRTFGQWQERLEDLLKNEHPSIEVINYKYGYLSVLAFIIPFLRWLVTRRFRREIISQLSKKSWDRIDFVAHSFGTYLLAWGLQGMAPDKRPKIHTIILAGSVLKAGFPWRDLVGSSVRRVVNDCGIHDKVLLLNQLIVLFTGMAGREGFSGMTGDNFRNRYFKFGHSGYFRLKQKPDDSFMKEKWLPLLLTEEITPVFPDPRPLNLLRGFTTFLFNNAEPIKLSLWITPLVLGILWVNEQRKEAIEQRNIAVSRQLGAEARNYLDKQLDLALLLSVEANRKAKTAEARQALYRTLDAAGAAIFLHGPRYRVSNLAFDSAGKTLVASDDAGKLWLWDLSITLPRLMPLSGHQGEIRTLALSPDGKTLVSSDVNGGLLLWDLSTVPARSTPLSGHEDMVSVIAFSHSGTQVVSGDSSGKMFIWDLSVVPPRSRPFLRNPGRIRNLIFSPDDTILIALNHIGALFFLDLQLGSLEFTPLGNIPGTVLDVTLSPNGRWLALGNSLGMILLCDLSINPPSLTLLHGHEGNVRALTISSNEKILASGDDKGNLLLWGLSAALPRSSPDYSWLSE